MPGHYVRTEAHRQAARERQLKRWEDANYRAAQLGKMRSEEYRKLQGELSRGRPQSEAQRAKIAEAQRAAWERNPHRREELSARNSGTYRGRPTDGRTVDPDGYVLLSGYQGHHLALNARVREHRLVLWEKIDGQGAPCEWCGRSLIWKAEGAEELVADHVNFDKQDNRPENLVPSCRSCNTKRKQAP